MVVNIVILFDHVTNKIHISTSRGCIDTTIGKVMPVLEAPKHEPLIKWPTWGHMTPWKIYISISMRFIASKLGRLVTLRKIIIMQRLKSLPISCFPDYWKVSLVIPVFINVEERSTAKNYHTLSLLSVVSKASEKLVNNRIVYHLEKYDLFSDFQCGFRSSLLTADLFTVVSDRFVRTINRSGANWAEAIDIWKAFNKVWHAGILHKLKCYGVSGQMFRLISFFLGNRQLWGVLDGNT